MGRTCITWWLMIDSSFLVRGLWTNSFLTKSRFIINVPDVELAKVERICFQVEQAHWFYEDFFRERRPDLPSFQLKTFSSKNILLTWWLLTLHCASCVVLNLLFVYYSSSVLFFRSGLMNTTRRIRILWRIDSGCLFVVPLYWMLLWTSACWWRDGALKQAGASQRARSIKTKKTIIALSER
jgi:hypothetical protein